MQQMCYNDGNNLRGVGVASGVYEIEDLGNGRVYVGSSVDVEGRLRRHRSMLEKGTHFCRHLQNSYTLRGPSMFQFRLVSEVSRDALIATEEAAIRAYPPDRLYNRILSPIKGVLGIRWTMREETKQRISAANKGRGVGITRPTEVRAKIVAGLTGRLVSEETRQKLRTAMQAYPDSARRAIGASKRGQPSKLRGRTLSPERIEQVRAASLGRRHTPEARAKMSNSHLGKKRGPMSTAVRQKISAAKMGHPSHPQSAETRAKMSAAQREAWKRRKGEGVM